MKVFASPSVRDVDAREAERLLRDGAVRVLDVRTPEEYEQLGHVPGAILLPVDLAVCAPATLPQDGAPLLVYCEHGVRSAAAAGLLARAGFANVSNLAGGMCRWTGPRDFTPGNPFARYGPCSWLLENADLLPPAGRVLDVACGRGRHTLLLAAAGFNVRAVDRDAEKIEALGDFAQRLGLKVDAEAMDLEVGEVDLGESLYDAILVVHYLHRPLFPVLLRALRPGGILLYETFTVEQAAWGHPKNPAFLLKHGELQELVQPLEVLRQRDGDYDERMVAGVVARKTIGS
jgi:tellurite methyltransferase